MAGMLARLVEPIPGSRYHVYPFWRSMCRAFTGHLTISAIVFHAGVVIVFAGPLLMIRASGDEAYLWVAGMLLSPLLWWWHCLSRAVAARSHPSAGRTLVTLCIPVIGLLSIMLGVCLGILVVFALGALLWG
jgi:hypothetical protein